MQQKGKSAEFQSYFFYSGGGGEMSKRLHFDYVF